MPKDVSKRAKRLSGRLMRMHQEVRASEHACPECGRMHKPPASSYSSKNDSPLSGKRKE